MQYSSFFQDLQQDSDEEKSIEKNDSRNEDLPIELPGQEAASHFSKFEIKFRN